MIVVLIVFAHFMLKILLFSGLKVPLQAPASIVSLTHDALMVFPFLIVTFLGMYSSVEALIIFVILGWIIIFGLLPSSTMTKRDDCFVNVIVSRSILIFCAGVYLTAVIVQNPGILYGFSLKSIFITANANSIARYSSELVVTPLYKVGVVLAFGGATFGGYYVSKKSSGKDRFFSLLPLMSGFCDALLMGARSGFMILLFTYMASYYIGSLRSGRLSHITYSTVVPWLALRLGGVFAFFVFVQLLRGGDSAANIPRVIGHVLTWFFGHVSAFSVWINDFRFGTEPLALGARTFAGVLDAIGLSERVGGAYSMVYLGEGRQSNVFTAYRGVFEDFSIVGGLIFVLALSITLNFSMCRFVHSSFTFVLSVIILTFFAWSFVISIWNYNSIIAGQMLAAVFISMSRKSFEQC